MSSARQVPESRLLGEGELSADHAWGALRRYGGWPLLRDALARFRSGDGFSHARALGLQLCLAAVPLLIALNGLATKVGNPIGGSGSGRNRPGPDPRGERVAGRPAPHRPGAHPRPEPGGIGTGAADHVVAGLRRWSASCCWRLVGPSVPPCSAGTTGARPP